MAKISTIPTEEHQKGISSLALISKEIKMGKNVFIDDFVVIKKDVEIGDNVRIMNGAYIASNVRIANGCFVGNKAFLRGGTVLKENVVIGAMVEIKDTIVNRNSGVYHLAFVGKAVIGSGTKIGAGVKIANKDFDNNENETVIGNNVQIGCNSTLIAPLKIGNNVQVAAGTVLFKNIGNSKLVYQKRETIIKEVKGKES